MDLNLLVPPYIAPKTVFSSTRFRCKKCILPFIYGAKINFWLVNFKGIVYVSYILEILFHKQGLECDIILMSFDGDASVTNAKLIHWKML